MAPEGASPGLSLQNEETEAQREPQPRSQNREGEAASPARVGEYRSTKANPGRDRDLIGHRVTKVNVVEAEYDPALIRHR